MIDFVTYIFLFLGVVFSLIALFIRNLIYVGLSFFGILFSIAALFVLNGADFLAMSQIIVYVGGVLVLLLFGVMLTQRRGTKVPESGFTNIITGVLTSATVGGGVLYSLRNVKWGNQEVKFHPIKDLGLNLLTTHLLVFELLSIFLLLALIGAIYISRD